MNTSAPNFSLTGSQSLVTRKCHPKRWSATFEPSNSSQPIKMMSAKMESAITSVSHLNTSSPGARAAGATLRSFCVTAISLMTPSVAKQKDEEREERRSSSGSPPQKYRGGGAKSSLNCVQQLHHALLHVFRQWRVIQLLRELLTVGDGPFQEGDQLLAAGGVLEMLINEHPACAGNGIGIVARRVDHRETEIVGNLCRGQRRADGFERRVKVVARRVFHLRVRHVILQGIGQFHVADGAG